MRVVTLLRHIKHDFAHFRVVQALFGHQILNVIMCFLQVFADFLSCVVNFWPGDDFLGGSSAKTSIFPYHFLER